MPNMREKKGYVCSLAWHVCIPCNIKMGMLSLYRESYIVSVQQQVISIMNILQPTQDNTPLPFVKTDLLK